MDSIHFEINRLNFENILWFIFIVLSILNIIGDNYEKKFVSFNDYYYKVEANKIFEFTLIVSFFIYLYFLYRNYNSMNNVSNDMKEFYEIKFLGSLFLIIGILCLIYFQEKQTSFVGSPAL